MKKLNILILFIAIAWGLNSQIVINEFQPDADMVEIKNTGAVGVNVSSYQLCSFPDYVELQNLTLESGGDLMLMPGEIIVLSGHFSEVSNLADNELGLYINGSFGSSSSIIDYVEWGSTGHTRSGTAVTAGIWSTGDFLAAPAAGMSVSWDGSSNAISSWSVGASTFGEENAGGCTANGGVISTNDPTTICAGDEIEDPINVTFEDVVGMNSIFVITDEEGNVLGAQTESVFDFDESGSGVCLIWHLSYDDEVNIEVTNADELEGCFDLSNSIAITRNQPIGGVISTEDETNICLGQGQSVNVTIEDVAGTNSLFVITDQNLNILGSQTETTFSFEEAGAGTCLIWHLSYEDGVDLNVSNAADLTGCYSLSNSIEINRTAINGGIISTDDPTTICIGQEQTVTVTFEEVVGTNSVFVITDEDLNVLSSQAETTFNFEEAGIGTCLIWHLSYEDGVDLDISNAADLEGCFSLSNSIEVTRNEPQGGVISTADDTNICTSDGMEDLITVDFEGVAGSSSLFVVTDTDLNILSTSEENVLNFEGAPAGTCLIWHLSYEDDVDLTVTNAGDLTGCFSLSNSIEVIRSAPFGGTISTTDLTTVCSDDDDDDIVNVSFIDVEGSNSIFVITDEDLNIIGSQTESTFNFEGVEAGVCLIWHLSYEDDVDLSVTNAADLTGCFSLSNSIEITRIEGEDCNCSANGGTISTDNETEICVGDGIADEVSVSFTDVEGTNSLFVVTDTDLNIIASQTETLFDFDGAEEGVCLIWHLSYEDDVNLDGLTNAGDLSGCFSLSNSIEIIRNSPDGGEVSTEGSIGSLTVIVGDDVDDNYTFENDSESSLAYVYITTNGNNVVTGTFDGDINFEDNTAGNCRIYGVSYSGTLNAVSGENIDNVSSSGCFELSENFVPVIKEQVIGLEEQLVGDISIYPTIVDSELSISGVNGSYNLVIYSSAGQLIMNQKVTTKNTVIALPNLAKGLYTGKVITNEISTSFRIIKK